MLAIAKKIMENVDWRHLTTGSSGLTGQARSQLNRMLARRCARGGKVRRNDSIYEKTLHRKGLEGTMLIRFAEITDLQQILGLYNSLNPDDKPIDLSLAQQIWTNSINCNNIKYVVAIENGIIIATCNIAIILNLTRSGRPYGIIENVITDEKYRRKGITKSVYNCNIWI